MSSAQEPTISGRKNFITIWLALIVVIMLGYAIFGERGVIRIIKAERQKEELESRLAELQQNQRQLREEIERLQHDRDYWEQLAREKLGMVRDGELIYHLPAEKKK